MSNEKQVSAKTDDKATQDKALASAIWHKATSKGMNGFYWQAVARAVLAADGIALDPDNDSQHKRLCDAIGQAVRNAHPNNGKHWETVLGTYNEATHLAIIAIVRQAYAFYKASPAALPIARTRKQGNSKYSV